MGERGARARHAQVLDGGGVLDVTERGRAVSTQAARRQLMRSVTAEIPRPPAEGDRAARREALLHLLEMSRRRRGPGRRT
ncbi:hypothetical protein [Pseudokineococcus sp. 1T1Z-3]|uniref:hypothetical protein n=1 Tax=Pseudokineococcus sp. 1T1Z-3 TaxID=3132745 RepID=UPI0030B5CB0B